MRKNAREVREYWSAKRYNFILDAELLDTAVSCLTPEELKVLDTGRDRCMESEALSEWHTYLMYKVFNRHNDLACGYSRIDTDGELVITENSSITELDISLATMRNCNESLIYRICDIAKEALPSLTFEAIAEVTAAVLAFNKEHSDADSD